MLGGAGFLPSTVRQAIRCGIPRGSGINSLILKVDPFCDPGSLVNFTNGWRAPKWWVGKGNSLQIPL